MLSPKIIKSKIHIFTGGGGGWWPNFDAESKNDKIPNSHFWRWVGGWGVSGKLLMLSPKMIQSKIHIFAGRWVGGGGGVGSQLLMLSPNLLKSKKKIYKRVG